MAKMLIPLRRKAIVDGLKVTNNIDEFQPVKIKKKYYDNKGAFIDEQVHVGYEKLEWNIKFKGEKADIILAALGTRDWSTIIVEEQCKYGAGTVTNVYTMTGDIDFEYEASKFGEPSALTLNGVAHVYNWLQDGKPIVNIDITNAVYNVGAHIL